MNVQTLICCSLVTSTLIYSCSWMDASLLSPANLLHCIKEWSGHHLCPQSKFKSPEKSTQRDSFRLQWANVYESAFAFRCLGWVCVRLCVFVCEVRWGGGGTPLWVGVKLCVFVCFLQGLYRCFTAFVNLCILVIFFQIVVRAMKQIQRETHMELEDVCADTPPLHCGCLLEDFFPFCVSLFRVKLHFLRCCVFSSRVNILATHISEDF